MERHWNTVTRRLSAAVVQDIAALIDVYQSYPQDKDRTKIKAIAQNRLGLVVDFLPPNDMPLAKVRQVRSGQSINNKDLRSFVVDFDLSLFGGEMPESKVTTSAGTIVHAYLKTLADQGVLRLAFEFEPGDATVADLQALLTDKQGVALSESWLARWSA